MPVRCRTDGVVVQHSVSRVFVVLGVATVSDVDSVALFQSLEELVVRYAHRPLRHLVLRVRRVPPIPNAVVTFHQISAYCRVEVVHGIACQGKLFPFAFNKLTPH